ncbi:MAG: hypothetical protein M3Q81_03280 [bacterium]|nr:hypothetical protein [bacterium]
MHRALSLTEDPILAHLDSKQQEQVVLSFTLLYREQDSNTRYPDYSFVVFPMAKAYEGFLKSYFFQMGLITKQTYEGRGFRVGRALNPDVRPERRDEEWLYDNVERACSKEVARELWDVWLNCRNQVFHYFPGKENRLTLVQASKYLEAILHAMQRAISCISLSKSN